MKDDYISKFVALQRLPYEIKVRKAEQRIHEFFNEITGVRDANVHISVGGLDSITLLMFIRKLGYSEREIPAIGCTVLEHKSIRKIHKQLGVIPIYPSVPKHKILQEHGFPVISKAKAHKIEILQNPDAEKQTFIHAIMTGDMGQQGKFQHSNKIKLPDKWLKLFAGHYNEHRPDLACKCAKFKCSAICCKLMKEEPCDNWAKAHNSFPYLGLMASEGGQREFALMKNGCNYYGKDVIRSAPFAPFMRQDILQLALDLSVPVPEAYGEIKRDTDGTLYTTKAQRTGCDICGFGIHLEKRPHRFDRLREDNERAWKFWMYECCKDDDGTPYGWGRVLDYIGVPWEEPPAIQAEFDFGL
ncbi:MAG: hypothetical protein IJE10_11350 [Clostridia bacterium]|nr:hypothetical protein [Clostridia bacterium]